MELLLGLGGNTGDPPRAFREALRSLAGRHSVAAVSYLYRTDPQGPPQARYFNLVARLEVSAPLRAFFGLCVELEAAAGRDRRLATRWGPRPLDLDLLMAPGLVLRGCDLELPHPRLHCRAFALVPAAELASDWVHPWLGRTLGELAGEADARGVERLGRFEL